MVESSWFDTGIIEAKDLPEGEKVYLRKDFLGWRTIEKPTKWYHWIVGGKRNQFILLILFIICIGVYFGIKELIGTYKEIAANPCNYCIQKPLNVSLLP